MNTGSQDAVNLGRKLALVARGTAHPAFLDTYESERAPVGRAVLRLSDRAFTIATTRNPLLRLARTHLPRAWRRQPSEFAGCVAPHSTPSPNSPSATAPARSVPIARRATPQTPSRRPTSQRLGHARRPAQHPAHRDRLPPAGLRAHHRLAAQHHGSAEPDPARADHHAPAQPRCCRRSAPRA
ncbi:MAG TPA: FAD-dependent monooxygenase [Micromonosporaceae bacterium]|nr:FAD-dependent monooxygenase [Micromonosporaceae bacterium]